MKKILIGKVEITETVAYEYYIRGMYLLVGRCVYELHYSNAQQCIYSLMVYRDSKSLTDRTIEAVSVNEVNKRIGCKIFNDDNRD